MISLPRIQTLVMMMVVCAVSACQGETFPGEHWQTRTPEEMGLDSAVLDRMREFMQGRGCVIRHGCMVYSWGDCAARGDVASAAKPWYSFFLFKAVADGRISDFDAKAAEYAPCLGDLNATLGGKDRGITFRHLATQTSCYGVSEAPGTAFDYNDWQMALFFDTLFLGVYGAAYDTVDDAVLHPILTEVLGCEDTPTFMALGGNRQGRVGVSPRDFCRFGYLFLRQGRWKDRQLLSGEDVALLTTSPLPGAFPRTRAVPADMCPDQRSIGSERIPDNQCDHEGSYSWLWWTNGVNRDGRRHWPDAPVDVYAALGHRNGMRGMAVFPSLDIVLSWNDTVLGDMDDVANPLNTVFGLVREAAAVTPISGQIVADPKNRAWLARNGDKNGDGRQDPFFLCGPGDPEDFLYRGQRRADGTRDGDQDAILAKMAGTGANALYFQAVRSHGGDGDATHNPFVNGDPALGLEENILCQWEGWFRSMDDSGIAAFFILYDDSADVWKTGDTVGPEEKRFLGQIVRRFEHHRNWIFCVAEEYGEALTPARVRGIAAAIRAADKHRHVIAVHKNDSLSFDEFAGDPNIGEFAVQWNRDSADALHAGALEAWRRAGGRYGLNMAEAEGFGFGATAREKCWAVAMAGAYVMALGWNFNTPNTPSTADLAMCGHLVRFFESAGFNAMSPHDELRAAATRYVLAAPGNAYIAYTPDAGGALGLKDMKPGDYALVWLDPETGMRLTADSVHVDGGEQQWNRPAGFDNAVTLHLKRTTTTVTQR